jgi:hypothetical protein
MNSPYIIDTTTLKIEHVFDASRFSHSPRERYDHFFWVAAIPINEDMLELRQAKAVVLPFRWK